MDEKRKAFLQGKIDSMESDKKVEFQERVRKMSREELEKTALFFLLVNEEIEDLRKESDKQFAKSDEIDREIKAMKSDVYEEYLEDFDPDVIN